MSTLMSQKIQTAAALDDLTFQEPLYDGVDVEFVGLGHTTPLV